MQPTSVKRFEALFLLSIGLSVVSTALDWESTAESIGHVTGLVIVAITLLLMVALTLLVSRKGSNIARWVLVVLMGIGLLFFVPALPFLFIADPAYAGFSLLQTLLSLAAICFLFQADAKPWFRKSAKPED